MPKVFLVLSVCYGVMQLVGLLFISEPTEEEAKQLEAEKTPLLQAEAVNVPEPITAPSNSSNEVSIPATATATATTEMTEVVEKESEGMGGSEVLKTSRFWQIWSTLLFVSMTNIFISSFYKVSLSITRSLDHSIILGDHILFWLNILICIIHSSLDKRLLKTISS